MVFNLDHECEAVVEAVVDPTTATMGTLAIGITATAGGSILATIEDSPVAAVVMDGSAVAVTVGSLVVAVGSLVVAVGILVVAVVDGSVVAVAVGILVVVVGSLIDIVVAGSLVAVAAGGLGILAVGIKVVGGLFSCRSLDVVFVVDTFWCFVVV